MFHVEHLSYSIFNDNFIISSRVAAGFCLITAAIALFTFAFVNPSKSQKQFSFNVFYHIFA